MTHNNIWRDSTRCSATSHVPQSREFSIRLYIAGLSMFGRAALNIILPPLCSTCDTMVSAPGLFCAACFSRVGFVTEPCCVKCGVMLSYAGQGGPEQLCPSCRIAPPAFSCARAAFRYDHFSQRLILPLKYSDRTDFALILAAHMARVGASSLRDANLLVPVPLHRHRLFRRRYNQASLLAAVLARTSGTAVLHDGLLRRRDTPVLACKSAQERHATVNGVFEVRPSRIDLIAGSRVMLIDDVMTSGATTNACAAALKAAGALDVRVLVAARVPDPRLA